MILRKSMRLSPIILLCCALPAAIAQELAERTVPVERTGQALSDLSVQDEEDQLPRELKLESAIYLQRRLGSWTENDARSQLGEPRRRRDALEDGDVTGDIYAFPDPSGRYREFELLFNRRTKKLSTVFIYPWHMTWRECRELWGDNVSATKVANGNSFRSYRERRLDVLLDKDDRVINLGVY